MQADRIVLLVHYFPPINSSGARRMESMSKYFVRSGRQVTVIAPTKTEADGAFSEKVPHGVTLYELNWLGQLRKSTQSDVPVVPYTKSPKGRLVRKIKDAVMRWMGQLPDPRLPFAFGFMSPFLAPEVKEVLKRADIVVATCPPYPPFLAAYFSRYRFGSRFVFDYRDQFSMCHEMPGGPLAKSLELRLDRFLISKADAAVTISEPMAEYYSQFHKDVRVILNGYDHEILDDAKRKVAWKPRGRGVPLVIRYMGIISLGRIPRNLLVALQKLHEEGAIRPSDVRFEFYGECSLLEKYIAENHPNLVDYYVFSPFVNYQESLSLAVTADHVLFCENSIPPKPGQNLSANGILTTKLFEYLASGRPIIADISEETLAGSFVRKGGDQHIVSNDAEVFETFMRSDRFWDPQPVPENAFVVSLSRAAQAEQYLEVLDDIVGKTV